MANIIRSICWLNFISIIHGYHIRFVYWQVCDLMYNSTMDSCIIWLYYSYSIFLVLKERINNKRIFLFCRALEKNSPRFCAVVLEDKTGEAWKTCQPSCWKASSDYNSCSVIFLLLNNVIFALNFYNIL